MQECFYSFLIDNFEHWYGPAGRKSGIVTKFPKINKSIIKCFVNLTSNISLDHHKLRATFLGKD